MLRSSRQEMDNTFSFLPPEDRAWMRVKVVRFKTTGKLPVGIQSLKIRLVGENGFKPTQVFVGRFSVSFWSFSELNPPDAHV